MPIDMLDDDGMTPLQRANAKRRQQAEERFREKMTRPVTTSPPRLDWVRAGDIQFDPRYQTDDRYKDQRAKDIAENWDWNKCDTITTNERPEMPGILWGVDGRHRVRAIIYHFGEDEMIPVRRLNVPYFGPGGEAHYFRTQHEKQVRVPAVVAYQAGLEEGWLLAIQIRQMVERLNLELGHSAGIRRVAADTFIRTCNASRLDVVEEAMTLLLGYFRGSETSMGAEFVKGFVRFLSMARRDPSYKSPYLQKVLERNDENQILRRANSQSRGSEGRRIALALREMYNEIPLKKNRLANWEEA